MLFTTTVLQLRLIYYTLWGFLYESMLSAYPISNDLHSNRETEFEVYGTFYVPLRF
jgi:hypothetical protein